MKSPLKKKSVVKWFTSTQRDGDARKPGALKAIFLKKKLTVNAARAEQVHGPKLKVVGSLLEETTFAGVDGFLTRSLNQPLVIFTADCVPVFLSSRKGQAVGLLHAGWRGVHGQILRRAVERLRRWGIQPNDIDVWLGPAIGPCCFEVQNDVAKHFPESRRRKGDRWLVDLHGALKRQARELGIHWREHFRNRTCTLHQKGYYSFRRNATTDRNVSVILMEPPPLEKGD